jgi:hemerythrin-like domain-containing protein
MKASEVRRRVLKDHVRIRALLDDVEALVSRFRDGGAEVRGQLRERGVQLHDALCEHLDMEDVILAQALREADGWGEQRAERLADEHREQRELFAYILSRLRDSERPTILLARELQNFVDILRVDMQHEEETELSSEVLRDDVVGVDVEAG